MADALFGADTEAGRVWFAKMRRWLKERPQGAAQVVRSAMQHLGRRKMTKPHKTEFWKAYRYLRRHRRLMDYAGYRRRGLSIGSGVTEAECKTVFTQRFKRSGIRWSHESGQVIQVILDLRVVYLSGIWDEVFAADLAAREMPQPMESAWTAGQPGSHQASTRIPPPTCRIIFDAGAITPYYPTLRLRSRPDFIPRFRWLSARDFCRARPV